MGKTKRAVILMNLGSPDSTEVKDVKEYLLEFLMDGRVIDYPYIFRKLLVAGLIVPFRAEKSAEAYKKIWTKDGSPLVLITREVQEALQQEIEEPVEIAMRYGNPTIDMAYQSVLEKQPGLEEVVAIPMYPHYAMSSYETAVEHAKKVYKKGKYPFQLKFIKPFFDNEDYLNAMVERIRPYLTDEYDHVLFSYHGIPRRHITKADVTGQHCLKVDNCCEIASPAHAHCYRHQCLTTMNMVARSLEIPANKFSHSFQSRLGREEWLRPYTDFRLKELPGEGVKKLVILCPAFVSDCLETLEEIAMQGRETFMEAGGEKFTLIPCLNAHPLWIQAIRKWIFDTAESTAMLLK